MEMQFYPPGWAPWPAGISCDATQWCSALNIDTFQNNANTGDFNNNACLNTVGTGARQLRVHHQERQRDGPRQPAAPGALRAQPGAATT